MADQEGQKKRYYGLIAAGCAILVVILCLACLGPGLVEYMTPDWVSEPAIGPAQTPVRGRPPVPAPTGPLAANTTAWERQGRNRPNHIEIGFEVTEVSGVLVPQYSTCTFLVHDRGGRCQTHVVCSGISLYGDGATQGFLDCEFPIDPWAFSTSDSGETAADGDAAISIDTRLGQVTITDDDTGVNGAFRIVASVSNARYPEDSGFEGSEF